ncbi:MAG: hypothetical protein FWC15_08170 [Fibromonadales bacterium]|nr:hypothetical protein [Fibromonadales bacterium]
MKKIVLLFVLLFGISFAEKNNALGLWVGDGGGWGVDYKRLMGKDNALDIYLGDFELGDNTSVGLGAGYYFLFNVIKADASVGRFPLHVGPNLGLGLWSGSGYGGFDLTLNIAGGITWFTPTSPTMDVSLEVVSPHIVQLRHSSWTAPNGSDDSDTRFSVIKGSLGLRFLFHLYFF